MTAKYKKIYEDIREKIEKGELTAGDQLADEISACDQYDCSRMTVKKAYDLLASDGFISRKQGHGSFVLPRSVRDGEIEIQERELQGFSRSTKGQAQTKVIHFNLVFATPLIAEKLGIKEKEPVYDILRLRMVDNKPYVLEQTYMSVSQIPGIDEEVLNHSIYTYIEKTLGLRIAAAQKTTRADVSTKEDQRELNLKETEPVLVVEQVAFLDNGNPFEYSISRHRYDLFRFTVYSTRT